MKAFTTEIRAINPLENTGKPHRWVGPNVFAESWQEAEQLCKEKFGYMKVIGEISLEDAWNDNHNELIDKEIQALIKSTNHE